MSTSKSRSNGADRIARSRSSNSPTGAKNKTPVLTMDSSRSDILDASSSTPRSVDNRTTRSNTRIKRGDNVSVSKRSRTPPRSTPSRSMTTPVRATPNRSTPEIVPLPISPVRRASTSRNSPPARSRSRRLSNNRTTTGRRSRLSARPDNISRSNSPVKECNSCNMSSEFSDSTVQDILSRYGYTEIEEAMIMNDNVPLCNFYFAINPKGTRVSVEVDLKTADSGNTTCKTLRSQTSPSRIPMSSKLGLFNAASPDIYGVVIACGNGICVMSRSDNGFTVERSFSVGEEPVCGMKCVQPLILLSDIITDAVDTVRLTETAANILRKNMYAMSHKNLLELKTASEELTKSINMFIENEHTKARQLGEASYALDKRLKMLDDKMTNTTVQSIDVDNRELLVKNLTWRKDLTDGLIQSMSGVNSTVPGILHELVKISNINADVNDKFEGFEYIRKL